MELTPNQSNIMEVLIIRDYPEMTKRMDLDQLIQRVNYKVTKQAMQFSLRFLLRKGYITKGPMEVRRKKLRRTYAVTSMGIYIFQRHHQGYHGDKRLVVACAYLITAIKKAGSLGA